MTEKDCLILSRYVPEASMPILKNWFTDILQRCFPTSPLKSPNLVVLFLVWNKYKNKVNPHGKEWKNTFTELLTVLLENKVFPNDLTPVVIKHAKQPKASSQADAQLTKALNKYNPTNNLVHLMELEHGTVFTLNNKRTFKKGEKRRTRYLCEELTTKRKYLINGVAEVNVLTS